MFVWLLPLLTGLFLLGVAVTVVGLWKLRVLERPRRKRTQYMIGGVTYYPVKVTRPVMEMFIEAQYEPKPQEVDPNFVGMLFGGPSPSKTDQIGYVVAAYQQLSILLRDSEGEHPDPHWLGVYLDVGEATTMIREILPA